MGRRRVYRDHSREDMALFMQMMTMLSQMFGTPFQRQEAEKAREFDWAQLMQTQKGSMEMAKAAHQMGMTQLSQQFVNQKELATHTANVEREQQEKFEQYKFGLQKEMTSWAFSQQQAKDALEEAKAAMLAEREGQFDAIAFSDAFHQRLGGKVAPQLFQAILERMSGRKNVQIAANAISGTPNLSGASTGGTPGGTPPPSTQPSITREEIANIGIAAQNHYEQQVQLLQQSRDSGVALGRRAFENFVKTGHSPESLAGIYKDPALTRQLVLSSITSVFPPGDNQLNLTRGRLLSSMMDPEHYKWFQEDGGKVSRITTGDPETDAIVASQLRGVLQGFRTALQEAAPSIQPVTTEKKSLLGGPRFSWAREAETLDPMTPLREALGKAEEGLVTNYPAATRLEESQGALNALKTKYLVANPLDGSPVDLRSIMDDSFLLALARPGAEDSMLKSAEEIAAGRGQTFDKEGYSNFLRGARILINEPGREWLRDKYNAARMQNASTQEFTDQSEAEIRANQIAQNATAAQALERYHSVYDSIQLALSDPNTSEELRQASQVRLKALEPRIAELEKSLPENTSARYWGNKLVEVVQSTDRELTKRAADFQKGADLNQPWDPATSPATQKFMGPPQVGPPAPVPAPSQNPSSPSAVSAWNPSIPPTNVKTIIEYKPQAGPPAPPPETEMMGAL